jgi:(p)ppGpp synthase/HD superfamily hydrolase
MHAEKILAARKFAKEVHEGQSDKAGKEYYCHVWRVGDMVEAAGGTEAQVLAGYLHDTVEDTDATLEEVEAEFGTEVAELVDALSRRDGESYNQYLERLCLTAVAKPVKHADVYDNLSPTRLAKLETSTAERLLVKGGNALVILGGAG